MDIELSPAQDYQNDDFQIIDNEMNNNSEQAWFHNVIGLLQEIFISSDFQTKISGFMNEYQNFEEEGTNSEQQIFEKFSQTFTNYLAQKLESQLSNFDIDHFYQILGEHKDQVDEQILDTLESIVDINAFHEFMKDFKTSHDQVQTYKVLTVKSNKIPENKTVKGKDNIFGNSNINFDQKMKKPKTTKQRKLVNKSQDQLLVPDLVLTVKGIRKNC